MLFENYTYTELLFGIFVLCIVVVVVFFKFRMRMVHKVRIEIYVPKCMKCACTSTSQKWKSFVCSLYVYRLYFCTENKKKTENIDKLVAKAYTILRHTQTTFVSTFQMFSIFRISAIDLMCSVLYTMLCC